MWQGDEKMPHVTKTNGCDRMVLVTCGAAWFSYHLAGEGSTWIDHTAVDLDKEGPSHSWAIKLPILPFYVPKILTFLTGATLGQVLLGISGKLV